MFSEPSADPLVFKTTLGTFAAHHPDIRDVNPGEQA
jgi:hypothetical protein